MKRIVPLLIVPIFLSGFTLADRNHAPGHAQSLSGEMRDSLGYDYAELCAYREPDEEVGDFLEIYWTARSMAHVKRILPEWAGDLHVCEMFPEIEWKYEWSRGLEKFYPSIISGQDTLRWIADRVHSTRKQTFCKEVHSPTIILFLYCGERIDTLCTTTRMKSSEWQFNDFTMRDSTLTACLVKHLAGMYEDWHKALTSYSDSFPEYSDWFCDSTMVNSLDSYVRAYRDTGLPDPITIPRSLEKLEER